VKDIAVEKGILKPEQAKDVFEGDFLLGKKGRR